MRFCRSLVLLTLGAAQPVLPAAETAGSGPRTEAYSFPSGRYTIEMTVEFHEPYRGARVVVYNDVSPDRAICLSASGLSGPCMERFVGAMATVRYSILLPGGRPPLRETIREYVTTTAQAPGIPERPPFSRVEQVRRGLASDLQVYGYDETPLAEAERAQARDEAAAWWTLFRQELYIGKSTTPFAVIEWKHTIDGIRIVRASSGAVETATVRTEQAVKNPSERRSESGGRP